MTRALIACIRVYQRVTRSLAALGFGPFARAGCRQWPTCSEYSLHVISEHGPARGLLKAIARFASCHPLA